MRKLAVLFSALFAALLMSGAEVTAPAFAAASRDTAACTDVMVTLAEAKCFSTPAKAAAIKTSRATCTAPCGVHFEGTPSGFAASRAFFELSYIWNFGDADKPFSNLPADFPLPASSNIAQGPYAAHVFEKPGDYTVTLAVTNAKDQWAIAKTVIHVADPDEKYAKGKTICYSSAGDYAGCPAGARKSRDIVGAFAQLNSSRSGRLLLRAGERAEVEKQLALRGGPFLISRYGAGNDPEIHAGAVFNRALWIRDGRDVTLSNIQLTGDYDASTGLGRSPDVGIFSSDSIDTTIYRTSFSGIGANIEPSRAVNFIIADNKITNWWNFGVLVLGDPTNEAVAIIGNAIKQRADAVSGPGGKGWKDRVNHSIPNFPDHGPVRVAYVKRGVVYANDLLSRNGWSGKGLDVQPALRFQTSGVDGHSGVIGGNRLEGGSTNLEMVIANAGYVAGLGQTLIERNKIIATENTRQFFVTDFGDTVVRNNFFYTPAVKENRNKRVAVVVIHGSPRSEANKGTTVDFVSNTIASMRLDDGFRQVFVENNYGTPTVETRNNLLYFPNISNAKDFPAMKPLDKSFRPMPGSPAYRSAKEDPLVFDAYDGAIRTNPTSMGAFN